jgi:hypothetical protein
MSQFNDFITEVIPSRKFHINISAILKGCQFIVTLMVKKSK